ncbi:hypothetical protein Tco_0198521, partial [Tanacetum coccineum]
HHREEALPKAPPAIAAAAVRNAYTRRVAEQQEVACLMLMKAYLDQMERLGYPMPLVLGVNMILTSLSKDYDQFMQNYNMHGMGKTIPKLHDMLKLAEKARAKGKQRGKGKSKLAYDPRYKIPPPAKKEHPTKET